MYVYMSVCVYIYTYVCMCIYMYIYIIDKKGGHWKVLTKEKLYINKGD